MDKFTQLTATAVPMRNDNIDTDAIIPAGAMKNVGIDMRGLGKYLFYEWRFDPSGAPIEDFILSQPQYKDAGIIVAGRNFGCGSSREHAVWALLYADIRCVIAPSFGDIFYGNCFKNGVLPAKVDAATHENLMREVEETNGGSAMSVDLETLKVVSPMGNEYAFTIDAPGREALLSGLDDIAATLVYDEEITSFQKLQAAEKPWLHNTRFAIGAAGRD
jgi:3-isopropylmalate/(R)-2-methylmalate dehydratase small subunit